ncbi:MAG: hypothetical protein HeimC3_41160 [Candidatus Heimdallarchaeota archaeon LC_3]|nr:MAG: hypothetical protein HeimC3_41160 [Candidatus Heimdallarchaeota archaeon LC_3]
MSNEENVLKITKMAKNIYKGLLNEVKPIIAQELAEKLNLNIRSVRYGLRILIDQKKVFKYSNFKDMRKTLYCVLDNFSSVSNNENALELFL